MITLGRILGQRHACSPAKQAPAAELGLWAPIPHKFAAPCATSAHK
jgi:hypothetical protein